jgi:hypothetical protein
VASAADRVESPTGVRAADRKGPVVLGATPAAGDASPQLGRFAKLPWPTERRRPRQTWGGCGPGLRLSADVVGNHGGPRGRRSCPPGPPFGLAVRWLTAPPTVMAPRAAIEPIVAPTVSAIVAHDRSARGWRTHGGCRRHYGSWEGAIDGRWADRTTVGPVPAGRLSRATREAEKPEARDGANEQAIHGLFSRCTLGVTSGRRPVAGPACSGRCVVRSAARVSDLPTKE